MKYGAARPGVEIICTADPFADYTPVVVVRKHQDYVTAVTKTGERMVIHKNDLAYSYSPTGKHFKVLVAKRSDGWWHYGVVRGKRAAINAGCQTFSTLKRARKHWTNRRRDPINYPDSEHGRWCEAGRRMRFVFTHTTKFAARQRATDKRLNKWSLAFVRKVERLLAKA